MSINKIDSVDHFNEGLVNSQNFQNEFENLEDEVLHNEKTKYSEQQKIRQRILKENNFDQ